ncbi:MAG: EamA family transporter [Dissulfurispiraceae bacterium]|jgi:drug/metabolite transporter (DMT)-like permease
MTNLWIPLALTSAFLLATSDALTKKALSTHNVYFIAWLRLLFSLPLLGSCLFFIPVPNLDNTFYRTVLTALPLEIIALVLYTKALKVSPMSLSLPFLSLTPVFLIIVPYLILGESISLPGAFGVLCIAAGGYTLNINKFSEGILGPFAAIRKEKGALMMIAVAFIYSFTSALGKKAIEHSSPVFFGVVYYIIMFVLFTPVALFKSRGQFRKGAIRAVILPGMLDSVTNVTHMTAMSLTKVAYMISVKRLSLLIGVIYGYLFFKESGIKERLTGTLLMLAGFVIIVLYH